MPKKEIEGDWVLGWPDRKRPQPELYKDVEGRVVYSRTPFRDHEGLITPTDASYVVAQMEMPDPVHPEDHIVSIFGEVETPLDYTLDEVRKLPGRTVRAVIECAGNDADFFAYLDAGAEGEKPSFQLREEGRTEDAALKSVPATCLVSGGEWTGVPLSEVLGRTGVKPNAVAVRFQGWDRARPDPNVIYNSAARSDFDVFDPGIINFDKALPIEKAIDPDTILAWAHNGEYLQHVHGAPLRLIVPGWAGNWWVKWIEKIEVMDHMPQLYHQTHYFVSGKSPDDPNKKMMTALGSKSVITDPRDEDAPLLHGSHAIRGLAWSGEGRITSVEVSLDGGKTWQVAHIEFSPDKWLWRRWSFLWEVDEPGDYTIMARATDEKGRIQPQTGWNFLRKHFDGIVPTHVTVV